jgi:uncharacterized low-complexity protein
MAMSSKIGNSLCITIGTAVVGSVSLNALAAASPVFQMTQMASGYAIAVAPEGKCGEGKCAVAKLDKNGDGKVSTEEAMAGGFSENQCKTWDKNQDGSLEANELSAMHAVMDPPYPSKKKT